MSSRNRKVCRGEFFDAGNDLHPLYRKALDLFAGESGFLLTTETDVVQVNADAALLDGMENGMTVTVYSNGAMTMSLPGQIGAEKIVKAE